MLFNLKKSQECGYRYTVYIYLNNKVVGLFSFHNKKELFEFIDTYTCENPENEYTFSVDKITTYHSFKIKGGN